MGVYISLGPSDFHVSPAVDCFSERLNPSGTVVAILSTGKIRSWVKYEFEFPGNFTGRKKWGGEEQ